MARHATVAPPAAVGYAIVKGELRVPNTINFSVFPTLDPFAKAIYYQLYLLSHGFRKDTCLISLAKLSKCAMVASRQGGTLGHSDSRCHAGSRQRNLMALRPFQST